TRFSRDWSSDVCSSDLGGAGQENGGTLDFAQFTPAPQGGGADDKFFSFFRVGNGNVHFREEGAGTNSVYVHVKRCHFKTQRTRHLHNGTLTGGIRRPVRKPDKSQCAGHIDRSEERSVGKERRWRCVSRP